MKPIAAANIAKHREQQKIDRWHILAKDSSRAISLLMLVGRFHGFSVFCKAHPFVLSISLTCLNDTILAWYTSQAQHASIVA